MLHCIFVVKSFKGIGELLRALFSYEGKVFDVIKCSKKSYQTQTNTVENRSYLGSVCNVDILFIFAVVPARHPADCFEITHFCTLFDLLWRKAHIHR